MATQELKPIPTARYEDPGDQIGVSESFSIQGAAIVSRIRQPELRMQTVEEAVSLSLGIAAAKQQWLGESGRFDGYLVDSFRQFLIDPLAHEVKEEHDNIPAKLRTRRMMQRLRGKLFERLAYCMISAYQPQDMALLSPEDTLVIYKLMYPERENTRNGVQESLRGISVPDGLVLKTSGEDSVVIRELEYTKVPWLNINKTLKASRIPRPSSAFEGSERVIVHPRLSEERSFDLQAIDISRLQVPLDHREIEMLEDRLFTVS